MKILDNYIAKQIILTILVVAFALLGFDLFFKLVDELKLIGRGQYTLSKTFMFLILTIPSRLYVMFPWSALIGALIGLGSLANHSELVVMRTASISVTRITWAVLKAAFILMVFVVFLGEGVAPTTDRLASDKRTLALSGGQTIQTDFGLWVRQGREFIHIQTTRSNGELLAITRYQFDENRRLTKALFAERAVLIDDVWHLYKVSGTEFSLDKTRSFKVETQTIQALLEPEILETAMVKHPERLSLPALFRTIQHRSKNALNTQSYELAFWSKMVQPIVILMMVFLAVPFVFGPLRTGSQGRRAVVGILVAFLFHTVNNLFAPLAVVYQFPPMLAVLSPVIAFSAVGLWMLHRAK
ncbi:MAG TPA: LPS export ABC transporter permease LptG [Gammaproteobacteria bacterium]|nr:LPS export ABC transporter permease LptG [Gammaproteobacteria bacterium]